jgi:hypothetical protein
MLCNGPDPTCTAHPNGVGNCYFCARQHYHMTKAAATGAPMPAESSNQLAAEYLSYDHGQDNGVVVADVLLAEYNAGLILAFAPVDHTSREACDAAMQQFKGLILGVDLTDDADDLFEEGEPWTVADGQQPDPDDGHCILRVKSTGSGSGAMSTDVTWGAEQESTAAWDAACIQEAWVTILSEDEVSPEALAAMRADIDALGGHDITTPPAPAPPPPSPAPTPGPSPEPADLLAELVALIRSGEADLENWLRSHGL